MNSGLQQSIKRLEPWPAWLAAEAALSPAVRECHRAVIGGFLAFCAGRGQAPSVALAREHVELERLAQSPSPARLAAWKEALNWYFRRVRVSRAPVGRGVPPLARADLGRTPWEQALIAGIRERHLAWRTEQTYRGWVWRLVRWLAGERGREGSSGEVSPAEAGRRR